MEFDSQLHKVKRLNSSVYANYMYDKRYVVDATLSYIGSPSFSKQMRFGLFPTVGLGWVISEESFMDSAEWLDYLKLRGSYGILGSTLYASNRIVSNYYYSDKWTVGGTYPGTSFNNIVTASQTGNPYATFQKSNELNIGFDFAMFNNSLSGSIGWFNNLFTGGLTNMSAFAAGVTGKNATLKFENYTSFMSTGVEADLRYDKRFGDFELSVAGNVAYAYSQALKRNELNYPDEFAGLRSDVRMGDILGYRYIGTFASEEDIKNSPVQALSKIYPGDFKYADENGDGIVDEEDRRVIGNSQPSIQYGLSVDLRYKGFNVGVYGYGLAGFDRVLNGKYYQNYGTRKYSKVLVNGLPNGNPHPTVRATNTVNNFQNSEYWLIDGALGDPVPVQKAFDLGCDKVVLILTLPENTVRTSKKDDRFAKRIRKEFPVAAEALHKRAQKYNEGVALSQQYAAEGKLLIIAPDDTCGVHTLCRDAYKMRLLYGKGYTDGTKITKFLLE